MPALRKERDGTQTTLKMHLNLINYVPAPTTVVVCRHLLSDDLCPSIGVHPNPESDSPKVVCPNFIWPIFFKSGQIKDSDHISYNKMITRYNIVQIVI